MSIGEIFRVKRIVFRDFLKAAGRYFPKSGRFALAGLLWALVSCVRNPYRLCRSVYGETPYLTLQRIAEFSGLEAKDLFFELGAGRGKGCFWVSSFIGCRVVGIERVAFFSKVAKRIAGLLRFSQISFLEGDFLSRFIGN